MPTRWAAVITRSIIHRPQEHGQSPFRRNTTKLDPPFWCVRHPYALRQPRYIREPANVRDNAHYRRLYHLVRDIPRRSAVARTSPTPTDHRRPASNHLTEQKGSPVSVANGDDG